MPDIKKIMLLHKRTHILEETFNITRLKYKENENVFPRITIYLKQY